MNATRITGLMQKAMASLLVTSIMVLAAVTTVGAAPYSFTRGAKGVSVQDRVQAQSDLCMVGGGTTTVSSGVFGGIASTSCKGGKQDGMKCTNTENKTTCSMPRLVGLADSKLGEVLSSSSVGSLEPVTALETDTTEIDQGAVGEEAPSVAPEPTSTPEGAVDEIDQGAVIEEAPEIATEPTATPEGDKGLDETVISDEPLTVDPGTEGDSTAGAKSVDVKVVVGDGSMLPVLEVDEQQ